LRPALATVVLPAQRVVSRGFSRKPFCGRSRQENDFKGAVESSLYGALVLLPPFSRPPMKMLTKLSAIAVILAATVVFAKPIAAQNNITQQQVGNFTYYGGSYDGKPVSGTAQRIGTTIYYNLNIGGVQKNWTEQVVGQTTYRNGPDGESGSSQKIGNQTYSRSSSGVTYTQQKIGNIIYITGSNGCSSTIQIIGNQRYTNGTC